MGTKDFRIQKCYLLTINKWEINNLYYETYIHILTNASVQASDRLVIFRVSPVSINDLPFWCGLPEPSDTFTYKAVEVISVDSVSEGPQLLPHNLLR